MTVWTLLVSDHGHSIYRRRWFLIVGWCQVFLPRRRLYLLCWNCSFWRYLSSFWTCSMLLRGVQCLTSLDSEPRRPQRSWNWASFHKHYLLRFFHVCLFEASYGNSFQTTIAQKMDNLNSSNCSSGSWCSIGCLIFSVSDNFRSLYLKHIDLSSVSLCHIFCWGVFLLFVFDQMTVSALMAYRFCLVCGYFE